MAFDIRMLRAPYRIQQRRFFKYRNPPWLEVFPVCGISLSVSAKDPPNGEHSTRLVDAHERT
jgi:hypothetical protein